MNRISKFQRLLSMGNFNELFSVVDKFSSAGSNVNIMLKLCLNIIIN